MTGKTPVERSGGGVRGQVSRRTLHEPPCTPWSIKLIELRIGQIFLFFHELLDGCIHAVGHIDLTLGADGNHVCLAEFAESLAGLPGSSEDFPIEIQLEKLSGKSVHHKNVLRPDIQ